jgi:hypothetical protein
MWVTQTYLGTVEPDASVFVYYLFEDYSRTQVEFTEEVQRQLEGLGEAFGTRVSLLFPNARYAVRVESEVRGIQDLWYLLRGKLPALLVATAPLTQFNPNRGDYYLIPFPSQDVEGAAKTIARVRSIANDHVSVSGFHTLLHGHSEIDRTQGWRRLLDAIELKPGIGPIKLDLKKLLAKKG